MADFNISFLCCKNGFRYSFLLLIAFWVDNYAVIFFS